MSSPRRIAIIDAPVSFRRSVSAIVFEVVDEARRGEGHPDEEGGNRLADTQCQPRARNQHRRADRPEDEVLRGVGLEQALEGCCSDGDDDEKQADEAERNGDAAGRGLDGPAAETSAR